MATIATFGSISWEISQSQINSLEDISTSYEMDSETEEGIKLKPQSVTIKTTYVRTSGCPDLTSIINMWRGSIGVIDTISISGWDNPLTPNGVRLKKADVSNIALDPLGKPLKVSISATFEEPEEGSSSEASVDSGGGSSSESSYTQAIDTGANSEDKAEKKPMTWGDIDPQYEGLEDNGGVI